MLGAFVYGSWRGRAPVDVIIVAVGGIVVPIVDAACEHRSDKVFKNVAVRENGSVFLEISRDVSNQHTDKR